MNYMDQILRPRDRRMERFLRRKRCPGCGKVFHTRPAFMQHVGGKLVAGELGLTLSEGERLWRRYGSTLLVRDDGGELIVKIPDDEE